ncbi:MAG: cyclase [Solirubrobacteraceae bacterium]|jgi:glyoxylase-like metal-dependent hydrolase (beta-lactamase superfamily II)|nr:cyclase [Solirubrobacteraceae bacterium]
MNYSEGLHELGNSLYAYLQPDGGWGLSNAGLICDGPHSLLVDTLFDRRLTERMLAAMRRATRAAAQIDTLVNTHANGDHCYGNQLVGGARIVASERTAAEMAEVPPAAFAALAEQAPQMGPVGEFFLHCFGQFDFTGLELVLPEQTFSGALVLRVGDREVRLIEVGPAHTRGDTLVHLPAERLLFSGDILFHGAHPIAWAGPVSNWIAACDRILDMDLELIVPGHGPLAPPAAVAELKAYFEYLYAQAGALHAKGCTPVQAARELSTDRWAQWGERERLAVNLATIFRELEGAPEPGGALEAFAQMAELSDRAD